MVYPQLRAVWCTVSFDKINFNGGRAVMKFAKYYIGSCIKTMQMPIHSTKDTLQGHYIIIRACRYDNIRDMNNTRTPHIEALIR